MRHSVILCPCPRDALCEPCRTSLFAQLRGVAARRGEAFADEVAREYDPRRYRWPQYTGRVAELARERVGDLTRDPHLLELLAAELARWAERRWSGA